MSGVAALARPEIRSLVAYKAAPYEAGFTRLNANEVAWTPPGPPFDPSLNRYPAERPNRLRERLAAHYGVDADRVVVTRGSSEAIDLLVRCFCAAGQNDIVICPPTFDMYAVYARIQGAGVRQIPLRANDGFVLDVGAIEKAWDERCRLAFLCSPNNPTGNAMSQDSVRRLCDSLSGRGVVVIDAAYAEFSDGDASLSLQEEFDNVVVLRTLSKALGIAGARCGVAISNSAIATLLDRILPPYSFATPSETAIMQALGAPNFAERIAGVKQERARMADQLECAQNVTHVWPSDANFLLVKVADPSRFARDAFAAGILIRDFSESQLTSGCFRITIGSRDENDRLLAAVIRS